MNDPLNILGGLRSPTLAEIEDLAARAYAALPADFRALCDNLIIRIEDFPEDTTLADMQCESEFDLLGLFQGRGLPNRGASPETGELPNVVWLYRRPILDYWCETEETLATVLTHVLVHEIGHHFGLSDEDMAAIEARDTE